MCHRKALALAYFVHSVLLSDSFCPLVPDFADPVPDFADPPLGFSEARYSGVAGDTAEYE